MLVPNLITLYVKDSPRSGEFYEKIFCKKPSSNFPNFVTFTFENGLNIGLWSKYAKDFVSGGQGHRVELTFMVKEDDEVRSLCELWKSLGVTIEQDLHNAVFGLTFVALDPDGHRIRVCIPD